MFALLRRVILGIEIILKGIQVQFNTQRNNANSPVTDPINQAHCVTIEQLFYNNVAPIFMAIAS